MTDSPTNDSLANTAMEQRYRTLVRLNLGLILGLAVAGVSSAAKPGAGDVSKEIRATAFVLVDAIETELGRFACEDGGASIALWNETGDAEVQLGVRAERTWTVLARARRMAR